MLVALCSVSHRSLLTGDDEPKILAYAKTSKCSIGIVKFWEWGLPVVQFVGCKWRSDINPFAVTRIWSQ